MYGYFVLLCATRYLFCVSHFCVNVYTIATTVHRYMHRVMYVLVSQCPTKVISLPPQEPP